MAEWKKVKLEDAALLKAGKFVPAQMIAAKQDSVNIYPCFGGNGVRGFVPKFSHEGVFPIIGRQGALCGNVNLAQGKFYATEHAVVALPQNGNDSIWLYYALVFANLNKYATGQAQPGISVETVNKVPFLLPPLEEQKKIAATLSVWDSAIEKMEKLIDAKEDQKKSLIWKLIENTDAIRKEKIKIDDLFDEVCEKNHPDADVLTIIQGTGTLLREKSGRDIVYDKKSLSNYKFVKKGDFIIHLRSFEGGLEVANQDGIVSPAYIILRPKIEVSTDYLYALFHTNRFINYTISPAVEGARDGRSVKYDALKKQFINLPTFSEQKYIAKIITTAEKELSLLKQQLENYKKQKQGLMQKLLAGEWRVK